jgi:hypothetical protein
VKILPRQLQRRLKMGQLDEGGQAGPEIVVFRVGFARDIGIIVATLVFAREDVRRGFDKVFYNDLSLTF